MLTYILIAIAVILLAVIIWLASLPGKYLVERSIYIEHPIDKVWPLIYEFENWKAWSPWLILDPNATVNIHQKPEGVGSKYDWEGELVGAGEIEHLKIDDKKHIDEEIRFLKPWKSKSNVYWNFEEKDGGVSVTWGMKGSMPFFFRFMTKQMDAMIGNDYDRGLKMLREFVSTGKISSSITYDGVVDVPEKKYMGKYVECKMDEIGDSMKEALGEVDTYVKENDLKPESVTSIYHKFDFVNKSCKYTSGVFVSESDDLRENSFKIDKLPATKALKITFKGNYENLGNAWSAGFTYSRYKKLKQNKKLAPYEVYVNDPQEVENPDEWITEVYIPVK